MNVIDLTEKYPSKVYGNENIISEGNVILYGMSYYRVETDRCINWWRNGYLNIVEHKEGSFIPKFGKKYYHTLAKEWLQKEEDYLFYVSFDDELLCLRLNKS